MGTEPITLSWSDVHVACAELVERHDPADVECVWGPPMGGYPVAAIVAGLLGVPQHVGHPSEAGDRSRVLVVDDLVDSGRTLAPFLEAGFRTDALFRKSHSPLEVAVHAKTLDGWLVFPWEASTGPEDAVVRLLEYVGEDPTREGLAATPRRVIAALAEMTSGYSQSPELVLATTFDESSDEMVVVSPIRFASLCEHHVLPFVGTVAVGYVPDRRVVGLSKIPRLVHVFARRLQVQERMTTQIAQALWEHLSPLGVGVVVRGQHSCMGVRGVLEPGAEMVTSAMLGIMKHSDAARAEFLRFANGGG